MPKAEALDRRASANWDCDLVDVYRVEYGRLVRLAYLLTGHAAVAPAHHRCRRDDHATRRSGGERTRRAGC